MVARRHFRDVCGRGRGAWLERLNEGNVIVEESAGRER